MGRTGSKDLLSATAALISHVEDATKEEAHAHDQQQVREDRAEHGGLDHLDLVVLQGNNTHLIDALVQASPVSLRGYNTHDKLDGIAKCSIEQAAESLAQFGRDLLGGEGQNGGQRYDCQEVEGEDNCGAPLGQAGNDTERNEEQEDVDIV